MNLCHKCKIELDRVNKSNVYECPVCGYTRFIETKDKFSAGRSKKSEKLLLIPKYVNSFSARVAL